jgi:hypothetical protein
MEGETVHHETPDEALAHLLVSHWKHRHAPAKSKRQRTRRSLPAWASKLIDDRDATVTFNPSIPCPSCGEMIAGLDGGRGEIDDGGPVDVIQCSACLAPVVLDLRRGELRPPTEAERRRWRLTFWFVIWKEHRQGD